MKKALLICCTACIVACAKKNDWNCTCDYDGILGKGTASKIITQEKQTKANNDCVYYGKELSGGNGSYTCKLTKK